MNEAQLVPFGIAAIRGEEILIVLRSDIGPALVRSSVTKRRLPSRENLLPRCRCKADLYTVSDGCRSAVEGTSYRKLGPSFAGPLPDEARRTISRLMKVANQSQLPQNYVIEGHHDLNVIRTNHYMAEHFEPHIGDLKQN
jgi:hypothetical protein